jgi:hypothetical protein
MLIDPIQWDDFKKALLWWGEENNLNLNIPDLTDNLFNERTPLTLLSPHRETSCSCASGVTTSSILHICQNVKQSITLSKLAKLIAKINSHNQILPNQLRVLLKQVNQNDGGFEVLSKELFWKGYGIWKSRKRLISNFWKNIAPNNWKVYEGKKKYKKDSKQKKNSIEKKEYQCQNPFHFLKRHCNLSQSIPTPCSFFHILKRKIAHKSLDIRSFFSNASHNPLSITQISIQQEKIL